MPTPFRLATLLKLRIATRDERRGLLAQAFDAERILLDRIADVDAELAESARNHRLATLPGRIDVDRLIDHHRQESLLRANQQDLQHQHAVLRSEIDRRRDAVAAADREVRTLEKLHERDVAREVEAARRAEIKVLDEFATMQAARREEVAWEA
jgi:flagellar export protein FliJ